MEQRLHAARCSVHLANRQAYAVLLLIISTNVLVLPYVQSFAPTPLQQRKLNSSVSSSRLSSTTNYLDSLSIRQEDNAMLLEAPSPSSRQSCINIEPMTWDGKQIAENAYRVDLPPTLLPELRAYADRMGITDLYRDLVIDGRPLPPGGERAFQFSDRDGRGDEGSYNWMVQRPKGHWKSNMHWTSPADETAHDDYLKVLSAGGFDSVLEALGTYFNLEGLSAYHLSFIGVSHCEKGFIHADVNDSGRKAFNMIIPLLLQEEAEEGSDRPGELQILSDDETTTQFYKYKYNAASMVGDHALHATAACDYRAIPNGMRMAATVYIGDITVENVNHLLLSLTQAYPPVGDAQHLLDRAGSHWSKSNPSKKLPSHGCR